MPRDALAPAPKPAPRRRKTPPLDQLLRTREAQAYARRSRSTLYRLEAEGRITRYRVGGSAYWDRAELDALVTRATPGDAA